MPRIIVKSAQGPVEAKTPGGESVWVCKCGLSANPEGRCDGSHKKTLDEKPGIIYAYDEKGRAEVKI